MKTVILIITLALNASTAFASGSSVEKFLPNIRDRIRNCVVLPFSFNQYNVRVEHALVSHCSEVKVLPKDGHKLSAKIGVAGHQFIATLVETEFTDGDYYDVDLRDIASDDHYRIDNVPAYGDVLLGVLEGKTSGIRQLVVGQ